MKKILVKPERQNNTDKVVLYVGEGCAVGNGCSGSGVSCSVGGNCASGNHC